MQGDLRGTLHFFLKAWPIITSRNPANGSPSAADCRMYRHAYLLLSLVYEVFWRGVKIKSETENVQGSAKHENSLGLGLSMTLRILASRSVVMLWHIVFYESECNSIWGIPHSRLNLRELLFCFAKLDEAHASFNVTRIFIRLTILCVPVFAVWREVARPCRDILNEN